VAAKSISMTVPSWLNLEHVWLPYTQMKTASMPLPVVSAKGVRLKLADGRELIDGISSWWTACHGYGHPHILQAVAQQLETMPHVMFGGLAHEPAYRLARAAGGFAAGRFAAEFSLRNLALCRWKWRSKWPCSSG
jgi:adenosylmethionine-8-amino-7-oxononanoate aminotransferase